MTVAATKQRYVITPLAGDWIAGYRRPEGPTIDLLPIEAEYDLRAGTIAPPGTLIPAPTPASPIAPTDRITLLHFGAPLDTVLSDLIAFLLEGTLETRLAIDARLSEIADAGPAAQAAARRNLGLGGAAVLSLTGLAAPGNAVGDALAALLPRGLLSLPGDPGPTDITASTVRITKRRSDGRLSLWANDGGTMVDLLALEPVS